MIDVRQLLAIEKDMRALSRAMHVGHARAAKRAGTSVRAVQVKEVGASLNLRAGAIRDAIKIRQDSKTGEHTVTIGAKRRGVPLREFIGTTQTRKGLSVRVKRGSPKAVLKAAFLAMTRGSHAYGRVAKGSRKYGSPHVGRLPIAKLFGPSPADVLGTDQVQDTGAATWQKRITIEVQREEIQALRRAGFR